MKDSEEKDRIKNFDEYDKINCEWREIMLDCSESSIIMFQCRKENAYLRLVELNKRFEQLFKGLNE